MNRLGPYELGDELARGAMGVVYRARDPYLGRALAIKVIRDDDLLDPESHERFRREALALARLRHPNVVGVHSAGVTSQGHPYLVMDLLSGGSLKQRMSGATLSPAEAVRLTVQLADALAYAHSQGILHRDVKPANVLLDDEGQAVLTDFGLAKLVGTQRLTMTGDILGTPSFMAPEQIRGTGQIGPSVDVYALGATLYQMLAGRSPLAAGTVTELFLLVQEQIPAPVSEFAPGVGPELDRILARCLEKRPEARYPTMKSLAADLRAWEEAQATTSSSADEELTSPGLPASASRVRVALGVALGLFVGLGAGVAAAAPLDRVTRSWRAPSELDPELEATFARGESRLGREDYEGAVADYLVVATAEPSCDAAWRGLGQARLGLEDEAGLADLGRATDLDPRNVSAWSSRGKALYKQEDYQGAADAFQRAVNVRPRSASLQTSLAFCLQEAGSLSGARKAWERGRELDPRSGQSVLFEVLYGHAPLKERMEILTRAEVLDPGSEGLLLERADAFLAAERYPEAAEAYTATLRRLLGSPRVLLGRGQALVLNGQDNNGYNDIELMRELYPEDPSVRKTRGIVLYESGLYTMALEDFEFLEREHPREAKSIKSYAKKIRRARSEGSYRVAQVVGLKERADANAYLPVLVTIGEKVRVLSFDEAFGSTWALIEVDVRGTPTQGYVQFSSLEPAVDRDTR